MAGHETMAGVVVFDDSAVQFSSANPTLHQHQQSNPCRLVANTTSPQLIQSLDGAESCHFDKHGWNTRGYRLGGLQAHVRPY
jgi:hypothetical protein